MLMGEFSLMDAKEGRLNLSLIEVYQKIKT